MARHGLARLSAARRGAEGDREIARGANCGPGKAGWGTVGSGEVVLGSVRRGKEPSGPEGLRRR